MRSPVPQLVRACDEALASLDASLAKCAKPLPGLEPDVEAMITRPAATVAESVNLLDAITEKRGIGKTAAMVVALTNLNLDQVARVAVEGEQIDEVA